MNFWMFFTILLIIINLMGIVTFPFNGWNILSVVLVILLLFALDNELKAEALRNFKGVKK